MPKLQSDSLLLVAAIAIIGIMFLHHIPHLLSFAKLAHSTMDILSIFLASSLIVVGVKSIRYSLGANKVPLSTSLTACEEVTLALRNQTNMTEVIEQMPMDHQLEAIRFMEFLEKGSTPVNKSKS